MLNIKKNKKTVCETGILVLLGIIFSIIYISLCHNRNIWTDEGYTVELLRECSTFGEIARFTARDVHPPMYYWVAKVGLWILGDTWFTIKLVSVIAMFGIYMISAFVIRRRFGFKVAFFFTMLMAAFPFSIEYAIQMRMYSWCMLFILSTFLAAISAYENGRVRDYVVLAIFGIASAYSQYFAFAAAIWIYGILLICLLVTKKGKVQIKRYTIMTVLSILSYVPWLSCMAKQVGGVSESYWIDPITKDTLREYLDWPFMCDYPGIQQIFQILCVIGLIAMVVRLVVKHEKEDVISVLGVLIPVLVVITGVVLSALIRPIFLIRYVCPAMPLFLLALAIIASRTKNYTYALMILLLVVTFRIDYLATYIIEYQSTDTEATLAVLDEYMDEDDILVYNFQKYGFLYEDYFGKDIKYIEEFNILECDTDVYFLCTAQHPTYVPADLQNFGWKMECLGDYGLEQNPFWIYKITRE